MGVASAALLTGFLVDTTGWRSAFILPGVLSILIGCLYLLFIQRYRNEDENAAEALEPIEEVPISRHILLRVFSIILLTTAIGGFVFQSTTFGLPKMFDERLNDLAGTATLLGWYVFMVFSLAALAQLVVGYLVDKHEIRTRVCLGCTPAESVFLCDDSIAGRYRLACRDCVYAGCVWTDTD